jgi:WHG domain-containing protein
MAQLSQLFIRAAELGELRAPLVSEVSDAMAACAAEKHPELGGLVPPENFQAMIQAWATLHGATCLDAYGQFDWLGDDAREQLFESTLRSAAMAAGFPID